MARLGYASGFCLLALPISLALPSQANAAWLGYLNDAKPAVIVQSATVVNNVVRRGKPHLLANGQVAWDWVAQANTKIIITVYDAKQPARILYQGSVMAGGTDLFYSVQLEPAAVGPRGMLPPRAKLVKTQPTTPPPATPPAMSPPTAPAKPPSKPRR